MSFRPPPAYEKRPVYVAGLMKQWSYAASQDPENAERIFEREWKTDVEAAGGQLNLYEPSYLEQVKAFICLSYINNRFRDLIPDTVFISLAEMLLKYVVWPSSGQHAQHSHAALDSHFQRRAEGTLPNQAMWQDGPSYR